MSNCATRDAHKLKKIMNRKTNNSSTKTQKRQFVTLDRPLRGGEVRQGILTRGKGTLLFEETEDMKWLAQRRRSYTLRVFPHARVRRMEDGELVVRVRVRPDDFETLDFIIFGQEMGDVSDYVCRYAERRRR